ncbi:putative receptor protein kinase ZmPK1 [Heracleum sosnowskyi]|uniref:non-specific serine/threonine protein kinase n=1 Tax=Heracleum sosnowskyi TaxID=360622 RepID=A0AAD8M0X1_9APIA|nr:putative receptor protein kinase ZmPK1 [Heracleum sosnowskyi]
MSYSSSYMLYIFLLLLPYFGLSQRNSNLSVGSSLTAEDNGISWYSPSGDFAFGFQKVNDQFLLSIWCDKIFDKTIVWFVNDGTTVPSGSKVQLTADRGLVLRDFEGTDLWRSETFSGTASTVVFNDTGNFMIFDSSSTMLWDSFSNPTDTLLPTQTMEIGGTLFSRHTETNFTKGRFQLRLLDNGDLVLNARNVLTNNAYGSYYTSKTSDKDNAISQGYQYYHPKVFNGTSVWTAVWQIPDNICNNVEVPGSGACGFNSVCTLDDSRRPDCQCPESYSLLDPNDKHGSCKPNFTQSCSDYSSNEDSYDLLELTDTDWPLSDYEELKPISVLECRRQCLIDCYCAVAVHRGETCWKKKVPFANGRKDRSLNGKAFLKIRKGDLPPDNRRSNPSARDNPNYEEKKDTSTLFLVGSVLLGSSVFVNFILTVVACFGFLYKKKTTNFEAASNSVETNVHRFTCSELVEATNGFEEELGRGSFGIVYKGKIHLASTVIVAVKKIDRLLQDGAKEFKTEVSVIAQTHHKNLVRLVGYCEEEEHRLLVYEYMVNGTLAELIFGSVKPSWTTRNHIALEIICCRRSVEDPEFGDKAILTDWVWDCFQDGRMVDLVESDEDILSEWEKVDIFVKVGLWCVHEDPSLRPTMRNVIRMLEGVVDVSDPSCPSPFF